MGYWLNGTFFLIEKTKVWIFHGLAICSSYNRSIVVLISHIVYRPATTRPRMFSFNHFANDTGNSVITELETNPVYRFPWKFIIQVRCKSIESPAKTKNPGLLTSRML